MDESSVFTYDKDNRDYEFTFIILSDITGCYWAILVKSQQGALITYAHGILFAIRYRKLDREWRDRG